MSNHQTNEANKTMPPQISRSNKVLIYAGAFVCFSSTVLVCYLIWRNNPKERLAADDSNMIWKNSLRLSKDIRPTLYDLWLHPNLAENTYEGKVTMHVTVKSAQMHIPVHIHGLNVTQTKIFGSKGELVECTTFPYEPNDFLVIAPCTELQPGSYKIYMEFNRALNEKNVGFYRSVYANSNGKERYLATTKFEPTFARQAFPCFDEPSFKAKYDIRLVKPSENNYIALSNMNQESEEENIPGENWTTVKFSQSMPMSTYLACFIVCDFEKLPHRMAHQGFPITVYSRSSQIQNMRYALDIATTVTNYYVEYFGIKYPLPKLDLIAIPDFVSGAMENWGLITFRETSVVFDENSASQATKMKVTLTVAHELAHMWFGDLVTMKWWNDLWLNEGFASFMEYKGVDIVHPTWDMDTIFLIHDMHPVLDLDSTLNSHPIVQPVHNPDQITEIFDLISYNKGASVIRMLEWAMGVENFRKSVGMYMEKFKFENAETADLWNQAEKHGMSNITSMMDTWTLQMGYPVVNVRITESMVILNQSRFLTDSNATYDPKESPFGYRWDILISYITSAATNQVKNVWLYRDQEEVRIELPKNTVWLKANWHQKGFYRVNYDADNWSALRKLLNMNHTALDAADRANILDDALKLAEADKLPYETALSLTAYLKRERHYVPWSVAAGHFNNLRIKLQGDEAYADFTKYVIDLLENAPLLDFTSEETDFLQRNLRYTLLSLACSVGHSKTLASVSKIFGDWLNDPTIKVNNLNVIYKYGIKEGDEKDYRKFFQLFMEEQNPQSKLAMMTALSASKNVQLLKEYVESAKDSKVVRAQDFLNVLAYISKNPVGTDMIWDFVRKNWKYLEGKYTLNDRYLGNLIPSISSTFATESKLHEMEEFFVLYPEAGAGAAARKRAWEQVRNNIRWRKMYLENVKKYFKNVL